MQVFVDIENDGDLDIYVCNYNSPNELWINDEGKFTEQAEDFGVDISDSSVMAYFADFDKDRFVDFYLLTNRLYFREGYVKDFKFQSLPTGEQVIEPRLAEYFKVVRDKDSKESIQSRGREDKLFKSEFGRRFKDVTASSGIHGDTHGMSAVLWDYDGDNDVDIYVCNDFNEPDKLYENEGDGRFSERASDVFPQTSWLSKGSNFADVNNDGKLDLFTIGKAATDRSGWHEYSAQRASQEHHFTNRKPAQAMRNFLHIGAGQSTDLGKDESSTHFLETAHLSGVTASGWSWAPIFGDFDGDGFCDLFVTTGHIRDFDRIAKLADPDLINGKTDWQIFKDEPPVAAPNMFYKNKDGVHFESTGNQFGLTKPGTSYAAVSSDLDRDGDLDLLVMNLDSSISLLRNDIGSTNSLLIQLEGQFSNQFAIGAKVRVEYGDKKNQQQVSLQRGFLGSREPILHFGLGEATSAERIVVDWPNGNMQIIENTPANQLVKIVEPDRVPPFARESPMPLLAELGNISVPPRREKDFDDWARQPLLPKQLSRQGPGLAISDYNRDRTDDLYVSGPAWQAKSVHLREDELIDSDSLFFKGINYPMDVGREELAPLFVDLDSDSDLDLFVVCGSVEFGNKPERLIDTVITNLGELGFQYKSQTAIPTIVASGSTVSAADFDKDGDLDLFLGTRTIPGKYPMPPRSFILQNETKTANDPRFIDATEQVAAGLIPSGLVTSSMWSDIDNDGWVDLLVTTEYGPVRVFRNESGKLQDFTAQSGLANHLGLWNGIAGGDVDQDGDIDFVVTNHGLNSRYSANPANPMRIRAGIFSDTGKHNLLESVSFEGIEYPFRSRGVLAKVMPDLFERFPNDAGFGDTTLDQLIGPEKLSSAKTWEVNDLASSILINDGRGKFDIRPLPWLAQLAPSYGVAITDLNADGFPDIAIAQNDFATNPELEQLSGGLSCILTGNGKGEFEPMWPNQSGLAISASGRSLAVYDVNNDNRPEIVVGVNGDRVRFYRNQSQSGTPLSVILQGDKKNRQGIGSRVQCFTDDGKIQTAEVYAGGSYLSQSTNRVFFTIPDGVNLSRLQVTWPDGTSSEKRPRKLNVPIEIRK